MLDFYDLDIATRKLCSLSLTKDNKYKGILCTYYESLSSYEQKKFLNLSSRFYDFVKCGSKKYKITKNSVYIANRLKRELRISCYPYIEKIATKGWSTSDGTFSWGMELLNSSIEIDREIFSFEPARLYIKKNSELNIG